MANDTKTVLALEHPATLADVREWLTTADAAGYNDDDKVDTSHMGITVAKVRLD